MPQNIIEVKNLSITYSGGKKSVAGCSFAVHESEVFGLLGSNGAGKSTIIKTLAGMIKQFSGEISILGKPYHSQGELLAHIAYVPQHPCMFDDFTVKENLSFFCHMEGVGWDKTDKRVETLLQVFSLKSFENFPAGKLSGGFKQLLNIALSSILDKKIIIFDEPTSGLDIWAKRMVTTYIKKLKKDGKTVILTTHDLHDAEELCDRIVVISDGLVLAYGDTKELLRDLGGGYTIKITFNKPFDSQVLKMKHSKLSISSTTHIESIASSDNIASAVMELTNELKKLGADVSEFYVKEPSLSEVFSNIMVRKKGAKS